MLSSIFLNLLVFTTCLIKWSRLFILSYDDYWDVAKVNKGEDYGDVIVCLFDMEWEDLVVVVLRLAD